MAAFVLSPQAELDIKSILLWTHEHFGEQARLRYEALIVQAILDVCDDAVRPGVKSRPELCRDARTYHLWHSRTRVGRTVGRVRHPRHFLVFRVRGTCVIEIGRIPHDSLELAKHLPDEYRG